VQDPHHFIDSLGRKPRDHRHESKLDARALQENFPVALRLLPAKQRDGLMAIYRLSRLIDELGDEEPGDRIAKLVSLQADLIHLLSDSNAELSVHSAGSKNERDRILEGFAQVARRASICSRWPMDLIQANLNDQGPVDVATFDDLVSYCRLSAMPVGRMVLDVAASTGALESADRPQAERLADSVCIALQIIEHLGDVGEDARRGRVYLPAEDRRAFGVAREELMGEVAGAKLRRLASFEAERAREILEEGAPVVRLLRGRMRIAVAGYVGGGRSALEALARRGFDVLAPHRRPPKARLAMATAGAAVGAGGVR
jgi:squalene synthase HpnC